MYETLEAKFQAAFLPLLSPGFTLLQILPEEEVDEECTCKKHNKNSKVRNSQ